MSLVIYTSPSITPPTMPQVRGLSHSGGRGRTNFAMVEDPGTPSAPDGSCRAAQGAAGAAGGGTNLPSHFHPQAAPQYRLPRGPNPEVNPPARAAGASPNPSYSSSPCSASSCDSFSEGGSPLFGVLTFSWRLARWPHPQASRSPYQGIFLSRRSSGTFPLTDAEAFSIRFLASARHALSSRDMGAPGPPMSVLTQPGWTAKQVNHVAARARPTSTGWPGSGAALAGCAVGIARAAGVVGDAAELAGDIHHDFAALPAAFKATAPNALVRRNGAVQGVDLEDPVQLLRRWSSLRSDWGEPTPALFTSTSMGR